MDQPASHWCVCVTKLLSNILLWCFKDFIPNLNRKLLLSLILWLLKPAVFWVVSFNCMVIILYFFLFLKVRNEEEFIKKLDCSPDQHLKVVSIFGNTGDGKSHTLNHTFFYGREVFKTSPAQESCTVGVWAAYDPVRKVVVIDTEGLLGATVNLSQRTRLLLKVLAISDLVIYRTRADRLHNDLFKFLGDASEAYLKHFTKELKATTARCGLDVPLSTLGPGVIIFHETVYTKLLGSGK